MTAAGTLQAFRQFEIEVVAQCCGSDDFLIEKNPTIAELFFRVVIVGAVTLVLEEFACPPCTSTGRAVSPPLKARMPPEFFGVLPNVHVYDDGSDAPATLL